MRRPMPWRRSACCWMRQARWKAATQTPGPAQYRSYASWRCRLASATWAHARVQPATGSPGLTPCADALNACQGPPRSMGFVGMGVCTGYDRGGREVWTSWQRFLCACVDLTEDECSGHHHVPAPWPKTLAGQHYVIGLQRGGECARVGRPDAALLGVLARHPRLPWAAALLQPSGEQLPELLRALLAPHEEGAGRVPGATPPAPAAAAAAVPTAGAADAGAVPSEPVSEIWKCMHKVYLERLTCCL